MGTKFWLRPLMVIGLVATLALTGCSDDGTDWGLGGDGATGATGAAGADGATGATGATGSFELSANEAAGLLACSTCHGASTAAEDWLGSKHAMNSSHTINACATCHNPSGAMSDMATAFGVMPTGTVVGCEDCHGPGSNHVNLPLTNSVVNTAPDTEVCGQCHDGEGELAHLTHHPINLQIASRFESSKHGASEHGGGLCSACHSHAGGVRNIETGRATRVVGVPGELGLIDKYTPETAAGVWTVEDQWGSMQCATCHDPHKAELRTKDTVAAVTGDHDGNAATPDTTEEMVVYSAQFNLCTTCHQIDLDYTPASHTDAGLLLSYRLTAGSYSAANMLDATTGTFNAETSFTLLNADGVTTTDRTVYDTQVFYHDNTPDGTRNFADTHFAGTVVGRVAAVDESADPNLAITDVEVVGYNINAANPEACTICHDPHTVNKVQGDSLEAAVDHAEGIGKFHTNYLGAAMGHGCTPCHNGGTPFMTWVLGGSEPAVSSSAAAGGGPGVIGCRSCHNLLQPADGDPTEVLEFAEGHVFTFQSGVEVDVADLGVNQICFECHKGREGVKSTANTTTQIYGVTYLHYAPVFATLFGNDSAMVPTYPGKTYAGRFVHQAGAVGGTATAEFGCVDCHDVHNTNDHQVTTNKMTNPDYSCAGCHGTGQFADATVLAARTVAYGERLFDTLLATYNTRFDPDITAEELETKIGARSTASDVGANDLAFAADIFKIFNYEDGSPHGVMHGHGGSWAHNSKFARQLQYDAIEALGGDLTGLTRP